MRLDFEIRQNLIKDHFSLQGAYSYINATNKTVEVNRYDNRIVFTPENVLKLRVGMSPEQVMEIFGDPWAIETEKSYGPTSTVMNLIYGFSRGDFATQMHRFSFEVSPNGYRLVSWQIETVH